ncbi:MAG: sugar ABC transporter permease [Bacillota bacterium]|nr:sugar ABC transporter permease [Bacillota bacterium]
MNKLFSNKMAIFIFTFPALLLFTAYVVFPIIPELIISFQKNDGFKSMGFVGISNYIEVLKSGTFWKSNANTFIIVLISTFIGLPISLLLALLMDRQSDRFRRFFKATSVFPAVLSVTVIAQMWIALYEPQWGLFNSMLRAIGLGGLAMEWLSDERTVILAITASFLWQYLGLNALLFYAGIKSIPKTYYEAACIDGASFVVSSLKITIPLLQDVIKYVLVL